MEAHRCQSSRKRRIWFSPYLLAVALMPAFVQIDYTGCFYYGDSTLSEFELIVEAENRITGFDSDQRSYDIVLPWDTTEARVRTVANDPEARVWVFVLIDGERITYLDDGHGGSDIVVPLSPGSSVLQVGVAPPGRATDFYEVAIEIESDPCAGVDCDDDNDCTEDVCDQATGTCNNDPWRDGTSCNFAGGPGECIAGSCEGAPGWEAPDSWVTPDFAGGVGTLLSPVGVAVAATGWVADPIVPGQPYATYSTYAYHLVPSVGWSDSTRIGGVAPNPHSSYLGIDAQGNAMFLWSYVPRTSGLGEVLANRFTPENGWEGFNTVGGLGPFQHSFRAVMGDDGSVILIRYSHIQPYPRRIVALRFTPTDGWGSTGSGIITELSDTASPGVAIGPNGHAIAYWDEGTGPWSSSLDLASGWGPAELVGVPTLPALQVNGSGRALAVWMQNDAGVETVWAKRYTPSFGWGAAEQFERDDLTSVGLPLVQLDDVGDGLAVWIQSDQVWANTLTASGWGVPQRIDRGGTHVASNLAFDMNPAGEAIATWAQEDAGVYSIRWTRFTPDIGWRTPKVFEDVGATSSYSPSTRIAEDGTAVMLWFRDGMTWMSRFE